MKPYRLSWKARVPDGWVDRVRVVQLSDEQLKVNRASMDQLVCQISGETVAGVALVPLDPETIVQPLDLGELVDVERSLTPAVAKILVDRWGARLDVRILEDEVAPAVAAAMDRAVPEASVRYLTKHRRRALKALRETV